MRKEKEITLQDREQKLTFKIREMSAVDLEDWLLRLAVMLSNANGKGTEAAEAADTRSVIALLVKHGPAMLGKLDIEQARPLLEELLGCCSRVVEGVAERCTPQSVEAYLFDVRTLFRLRQEALKLNLGFMMPEPAKASGSPENGSTRTR